jgi:hypothetical protein
MTARTLAEIIGSIIGVILLWLVMQKPVAGPPGQPQEATKAPAVAGKGKVTITPQKVLAYSQDAKQGTKIPEPVKKDPTTSVLDSVVVPASGHSQTVTPVLDGTGNTTTYVTTNPYPWLAMENEKRFTVAYGFKNQGVKVFRLQYAHEFVQIKDLHFGPLLTLDTDGKMFAGLAIRW